MKTNYLLFLVIVCNLCVSCVELPRSIESFIVGVCVELKKPHFLLAVHKDLYVSDYLISSSREFGGRGKAVYRMQEGEKLNIQKVLRASDGSWGKFLRVQVTLSDGPYAGTVADIPVHAPYHPRDKWTKAFTLNPNDLEFNENVVTECQ